MSFKLNGEKNNIGNHREHYPWFNTKSVIQGNNEYSFMKESSLNLTSPFVMQGLDKYDRKLPGTIDEHTFRLNQRCPKRRKIEHFKSNFILPFNNENYTMSVADFCKYKFKPECYKTSLLSPKLSPKIVLHLLKHPSINKLKRLLDLMHTESLYFYKQSIDIRDYEKSKQMSRQLKKYLCQLCYQKFCELWLHKTSSLTVSSGQKLKGIIASILKYAIDISTIYRTKLKKLIIYKGGFTGYPKISHLMLCINIIRMFFTSLLKKSSRIYMMKQKRRRYLDKLSEEKHSIKLYVEGTTKKKGFLDIVNEYKRIIKTDRLSFYEVADVKYAYENLLEPGEHITKEELDICANENYRFKINHNISSNEKNDDFVFDDIESTEDGAFNLLYSQLTPNIENGNKTLKCQYTLHEYVHGVQSSNNFGFKNDEKNESIEKIETESHIQSTSNEDRNIDVDISTNDLDRTIATNYSRAETSSENLKLERVTNTLVKKRNNSKNYSKISERFNYKLLSHPITLTESEKRMLSTIILADMDPYKVKWKRQKPSERTRLFQIIVYFGSLKMGLCDKLHLGRLDLRGQNICDMIDIEKLLKSIKIETCILQECFTFTEGDNFLTWPLGKMMVSNIISQRSPTINILFSFVKNIITKFCKKAKDFCHKSDLRIVLNKESHFESSSNVRIGKDVPNTQLSLKYSNVHTYPSPINNDVPGTSNSEHFCVTNTTLSIKESNTGHVSKFAEVYARWFCKEYLQDDKFYKLAASIFKNIFRNIDPTSECTDIKFEDAINNAFMILYDQQCFAKAYESYLNTKYPKCVSSSKHVGTNDTENHSDYKGVNIREELQIEPNVDIQTDTIKPYVDVQTDPIEPNVQTDPIDTNNVDMSLVPSNTPTFNEFDILNDVTIKNLVTPDLQSENYDIDSDFLLQNLINENSDNLIENIGVIDDGNNIFDNPDTAMMDINDPNYNNIPGFNEFNEDSPFDDAIPTTVMSYNFDLSNGISESNLEFQQTKNTEEIDQVPINSFDPFFNFGVKEEETNLQLQQAKNMEEVSMISSDQLVNFDQNDEINLNELDELDNNHCGFYNAGVLLPP